jgi:hypothetical protein
MEKITFNIESSISEEIQKHKNDAHALALIATLATDQQKSSLEITIECKTIDNLQLIADDILGNILKSIANKAYLRSYKKNNVFQNEYFGHKKLELYNDPPSSPDMFLNQSKVILDILTNGNSIEYIVYRKQEQHKCSISFVTKETDDINKAFRNLSELDRDFD